MTDFAGGPPGRQEPFGGGPDPRDGGSRFASTFPAGYEDPYELWDASYVLGSLSSSERREYEAHLTTCTSCRSASPN
jgi:hypothetical protein